MARFYTQEHEWIEVENGNAKIGITHFAQEQLGDIVFVELPQTGAQLSKGNEAAIVESVKAASEILAPLDGEVIATNSALEEDPALVNSSPEQDGWFFTMALSDPSQLEGLFDKAAYDNFLADL